MAGKSKAEKSELAAGLKNSLESLQASLDEWAEVEKQVKESQQNPPLVAKDTSKADPLLLEKLMEQMKQLSL